MNSIKRKFFKRWLRLFPYQQLTRNGIHYDLDCRELIDYETFIGGWEPETHALLQANIQKGMNVIEVGSNVGAHTLVLAQLVGETGHVYGVEPTDYAWTKLSRNVELNPELANRITLMQCLMSSESSEALSDKIRSSWLLSNSNPQRDEEIVTRRCMTVDELVLEQGIEKVDFIKIDVDGYDLSVLQGAQQTLTNHSPIIFVEICNWALERQGHHGTDLLRYLTDLGYIGKADDAQRSPLTEDYINNVIADTSGNGLFVKS